MKKTPLGGKRKKLLISVVLVLSFFSIIYGFYSFQKMKPVSGQKQEIKLETGDRPLQKNENVYVNSEKGLSLRKDRDSKSEKLLVIPDKTKLEATEELEGWYKVTFNGKEGWISKEFTTKEEPAVDAYKDWTTLKTTYYSVKYPLGWKAKNYGALEANKTLSLVAFSNGDLPESIPAGSDFIAPLIFKISSQSIDEVKKNYASISGVTTEEISVGGVPATKYLYTSMFSNTQMTGIVFSANGKVYTLDESGGYGEDLINMIKTMTIGG